MTSSDYTIFDKLCDTLGNSMTMEQILEFALLGKVILSFKIDSLNSFHDQFFQGLWEKSPNGCFYPLDDGHQRVAYVVVNANFEVECAKSMEKMRNFSVAHKVFDEVSEPNSCSNHVQLVGVGQVDSNVPLVADNSKMSSNQEVEMEQLESSAILSTISISPNENEVGRHDDAIKVNIVNLSQDIGLIDDLSHVLGCTSRQPLIDDGIISNAHKMFDKMPIPAFMLEMAQGVAAHLCPKEQSKGDHMFDKMPEPLLSRDLVASSVKDDDEDATAYENEGLNAHSMLGKITETKHKSASPLVMSFEPKNATSLTPILVTFHTFTIFNVENTVLWWGDNHMSSKGVLWNAMPMPDSICCHIVFDPGILFLFISMVEMSRCTMLFELSNGWKSSISYKEALSWGNPSQCYEFAMTSSFRALNSDYYVGSEMILLLSKCWKVFVINHSSSRASVAMANGTQTLDRPWDFILFDLSRLEGDTSSMFFIYTLEDKGDFRGEEDMLSVKYLRRVFTGVQWYVQPLLFVYAHDEVRRNRIVALWRTMWTLIYSAKYHTKWCYSPMNVTIGIIVSSFVFDPGVLRYEPSCDRQGSITVIVWVYDPGGIVFLSVLTRFISDACLGYSLGVPGRGMDLLFPYHGIETVQDSLPCCYTCEDGISYWVKHDFVTNRLEKMSKYFEEFYMIERVTQPHHVYPLRLFSMSTSVLSTCYHSPINHSHLMLDYGGKIHNGAVFVFDPGGNDEILVVMNAVFAADLCSLGLHGCKMGLTFLHHGGEVQGNDTIFIFDPGGQILDKVAE